MSSEDNSDVQYEDYQPDTIVSVPTQSGWGASPCYSDEDGVTTAGWGSSTTKKKGNDSLLMITILTRFPAVLEDTYASLDELLVDLGNSSSVQVVLKNIHRVQQMTWGEFLHSAMYCDWLHRIILGKEVVTDVDYDFARDVIQLLPGYPNVADFVGRPWSPYEDTYPGRFIDMQQLKHEIMQVILIPHGKN